MAEPALRTRDCTDPWQMVFIHCDRKVTLCCWGPPVGSLEESSLESAVQGEEARRIRAGLLDGDLEESCARCPSRGWTTPDELLAKVKEIQEEDRLGELEKLRRRTRRLESEREQLELHRHDIETALMHLKRHVVTIEDERRQLRGHVANLERILRKIHGMAIYRGLSRIKDLFVKPAAGRREETSSPD